MNPESWGEIKCRELVEALEELKRYKLDLVKRMNEDQNQMNRCDALGYCERRRVNDAQHLENVTHLERIESKMEQNFISLQRDIKDINVKLTGNGDPESGLIWQVRDVQKFKTKSLGAILLATSATAVLLFQMLMSLLKR